MSTPEGDISGLQTGRIEPVPVYVEHEEIAEVQEGSNLPTYTVHEEGQDELQAIVAALTAFSSSAPLSPDVISEIMKRQKGPVDAPDASSGKKSGGYKVPDPVRPQQSDERSEQRIAEAIIVRCFFGAIDEGNVDVMKLFIKNNLVTANTTMDGMTPLLAAVASRKIETVKQLIEAGAEPDAYGVESTIWRHHATTIRRTPLQLAAAIGHLQLVKLFLETYNCDDSLIAPDGQIALRLAATNGHREVVAYLPSRRGGGFLRWKTSHAVAIHRAKVALKKIYAFVKFFVWDIEKFFLWTVPKECIVKPLASGCTWCWRHRKRFGPWCKHQVKQMPERVARFGKRVWKGVKAGVKAVPKAVTHASKAIYKWLTKTLPKALKKLATYLWTLLTVRIPRAIAIVAKWIWQGIFTSAKWLWSVLLKAASLVHTLLSAIISFFRALTLRDVWNGFVDLLNAIFVSFPRKLWVWICAAGEMTREVLESLFGLLGDLIWLIGRAIGFLVLYIPHNIWVVIQSMAGSVGKAFYEFTVWINPKA